MNQSVFVLAECTWCTAQLRV